MITSLPTTALYRSCDPAQFSFTTTAELSDLTEIIGQERALASVRFGVGIHQTGYNLFALGPNGMGKYTAVSHLITQRATCEAIPTDWVYVYDFEHPHRPNALQLPPGKGITLAHDMETLVKELFTVLPTAFESEEYQRQKKVLEEEFRDHQEQAIEEIRQKAREQGIALWPTPNGLAFAPLQNNEVISPEQFILLPEDERKRIEHDVTLHQESLQKMVHQMPQWLRDT